MKMQFNVLSDKNQMLKARFDMLTKLINSQQKAKEVKFKEASANKKITFVNVK